MPQTKKKATPNLLPEDGIEQCNFSNLRGSIFYFMRGFNFCLLMLSVMLALSSCKKAKEDKPVRDDIFVFRECTVEYTTGNRILSYAVLEGQDTLESSRYYYSDSLVLKVRPYADGYVRTWYHMLPSGGAWLIVDSSIWFNGKLASYTTTNNYFDGNGYLKRSVIDQTRYYDTGPSWWPPVIWITDSIVNGNASGLLKVWRPGYATHYAYTYGQQTSILDFDKMLNQFYGKTDVNQRVTMIENDVSGIYADSYSYEIDGNGTVLSKTEVEEARYRPKYPNYTMFEHIKTTYHFIFK